MNVISLIDKLYETNNLKYDELVYLLYKIEEDGKDYLIKKAHERRMKVYGNIVYMRGLIEFTNYCKRACKYCGINVLNNNLERYRLKLEEILKRCEIGYNLGYRTFVLQGGEDDYYSDEMIIEIIKVIKDKYPHVAITLSIGEKSFES